ncbi:MAG: hypothetical protein LQ338_005279 [Usnochroma carphineum]|nr:MAG: hypothetical protein LQ338_005279 [Usnochroma carphineum]
MGPPITDLKACKVCTRDTYNEDSCDSIPNCVKQLAQATVQAGSLPVHVGTLTSDALSISISSALDKICPSVSQHSATACKTDSAKIEHIEYKDVEKELNGFGTLEVKVEASSYNESAIRKAMIDAAALTAMKSAVGSNCYDGKPLVGRRKLKRTYNAFVNTYHFIMPRVFTPPEPVPDTVHWCNAAAFAGVQYYGQFARLAPTLGATDYLDARWEFHAASSDKFDCAFLGELIDAMVVVAPEFALEDIGLGEAVSVSCETMQDLSGNHKRDILALPGPLPRPDLGT